MEYILFGVINKLKDAGKDHEKASYSAAGLSNEVRSWSPWPPRCPYRSRCHLGQIQHRNKASLYQSRDLLAVDGIQDTNIPTPGLVDADPFAHCRGKRFFDGDAFFYGDPFYHPIEHELHATEPQGYMLNDEPNDTRFDLVHPFLVSACTLFGVAFFYMYAEQNVTAPSEKILSESLTIEARASEVLEKKSKRIQEL